ncbi:MAG: cbb3-type cytochrome c oxidase subunit I [Planctomycetes bacterium]|nr:cbb3-type cytochrome c oxidase subunit I [Planctomycetota bacterium]
MEINADSSAGVAPTHQAEPLNYLNHKKGIASWLFTVDHKRIGLMYLALIGVALFLGGVFALAVRTHLLRPSDKMLTPEQYAQMFTLHGVIMIFLVIIPGIPAVLGNFVVPLMLGAKDVAFPKLNLFSWYLFATGVVMALVTLFTGGLDTGWTLYTPYSSTSFSNVSLVGTAAFIMGFSSILTGLNMMVTIQTMRPKGMTIFRMPLFLWAAYATGIIQIIGTPVLAITLLLLLMERFFRVGIFDPAMGGDAVLFQHFFWFYSHPAVYIMVVPAFGVMSELITVHTRKTIFGYKAIAYSSVAIAILSVIVWGHHLFVSGQTMRTSVIFSIITFAVAVPSAIKVFNWMATLYKGSIALTTPMLFALSFLFTFGIGGLTGLFCGALAIDVHVHDTYFVVAHFHYTMIGVVMVMLGGFYHWWPKITGKMYHERLGQLSAVLVFIGMQMTFLPQFIMGSLGMPRRYYWYPDEFSMHHHISTGGSYILAAGFALVAFNLIWAIFNGKKAPANPWGGATMEWYTQSPPLPHNFDSAPEAGDPYDYTKVHWDNEKKEFISPYVQ